MGQDRPQQASGPAVVPCAGRVRCDTGTADHAAAVPSPGWAPLQIDNFHYREWVPAIEAAGVAKPARIYDTRHTFASNAIAARIDLFELAKIMGTSIKMIERHYGTLIGGATESIASRLWDAQRVAAGTAQSGS